MKKSILALLAVAATGSVMAEAQPYATIINAEGLSTVSVGNQMMNATNGMKLVQGAQLLTTAKSAVTVDFAGGCTAVLKAGQSMNVNLADCKTLVAGQSKLNLGSGAAAGGLAEQVEALGLTPAQGVALAVTVAGVIYYITKDDNKKAVVTTTPPAPSTPVVVAPAPAPISGA